MDNVVFSNENLSSVIRWEVNSENDSNILYTNKLAEHLCSSNVSCNT